MAKPSLTVAEVNAFADKVKAIIQAAEQDQRTVQALRALLGGKAAAAIGRIRGRSAAVSEGKVLEVVKGNKQGVRVGEVVDELGISRAAAQRTLQKLRTAGQVKLVGHKRLAKYYAI